MSAEKPPIGVVPKSIWIQKRTQELARAIYEYIDQGRFVDELEGWVKELEVCIAFLKKEQEKKRKKTT